MEDDPKEKNTYLNLFFFDEHTVHLDNYQSFFLFTG